MEHLPRPIRKADKSDGVQYAWDSTSIKAAMRCPRYYAYAMLWGYQPKEKSVHLEFGGLYATALEHFYKHRAEGASLDEATRLVVKEAMLDTWDNEKNCAVDWGDSQKTRASLIRTIVWYLAEFGEENESFYTHHLATGKPAVELSFAFEMTPDIVLAGHLDRVSIYQDAKWVVDQKTTGKPLSDWWNSQFAPDTQFTLYSLAGKLVLDEPVKGVIVDGAQIAVGFSRFRRYFQMRTMDQINDWWRGVEHTIEVTQHLTAAAKTPEDFPMNTESCGNYASESSGTIGCPFRQICSAYPKIRPNLLQTHYTQRTWDPIEKR